LIKKSLIFLTIASTLFAGGGGGMATGGATEITQLLNNTQLVKQLDILMQSYTAQLNSLQQAINQVKMAEQNLLMLSPNEWQKFSGQVLQLKNIVNAGQAVTFAAANVDDAFSRLYPGYSNYAQNYNNGDTFRQQYQAMNAATRDNVSNTLKSLNMQLSDLQTDEQTLSMLQTQSRSATGQMQAIQAASEIAAYQANQFKKLHYTLMSQSSMQANWIAHQNEKEAAQNAATKSAIDNSRIPNHRNAPDSSRWDNRGSR
jgi:P-type conjugative transfer protein TrbJ